VWDLRLCLDCRFFCWIKEVKGIEKLDLTKLEYLINFTSLDQMSTIGIYSPEEIEDSRRNFLFSSKKKEL